MKKYLSILLFPIICQLTARAQELKPIEYHDGDQKLLGLVTANADQALPGVLILPAWKGIDEESKTAALELEKLGYIAFIADIYGQGNVPNDNKEASKIAGHYKEDYKAYQHRIALALAQLERAGAVADKIAVIGYCFGGTGALEVARANMEVKGVVCIHGGYAKASDRKNEGIHPKVLVEHAAEDKSISKADYDNLITELNEGNADWQIITYANSAHTFTDPKSADYNPVMAKRAWDHTQLFLKEILK
ncbi:dienelactone hydrolase family protein [Sphingobacterium sp. lm-10]|uniref:dienelactone hydrolase family protein n=1 Tax=Sphingobacterium sp. lm-10 TaxID=2944904 RepID=UPI0020216BDD|nr:dienelactone hydrolase family protein [Sphingobacterium sp. lm-10]MCL7987228.1 dienelactone hydrolase family protein [Sphingobacterium sp. lm-10]